MLLIYSCLFIVSFVVRAPISNQFLDISFIDSLFSSTLVSVFKTSLKWHWYHQLSHLCSYNFQSIFYLLSLSVFFSILGPFFLICFLELNLNVLIELCLCNLKLFELIFHLIIKIKHLNSYTFIYASSFIVTIVSIFSLQQQQSQRLMLLVTNFFHRFKF